MPALVRKLLICAATDGLLLQPLGPRDRSPESNAVHIAYGTSKITGTAEKVEDESRGQSIEAHGLVGSLVKPYVRYVVR